MSSETKAAARRFLPGNFLVATPYIKDSPYRRSVVLVIRHDVQGALGLVLDNRLEASLGDRGATLPSALRQAGNLNGGTINGGPAGGPERFVGQPEFQMFTGLVLWPAGKLEQEVDLGVWMVTPARIEGAMRRNDLWVDLVRQIGRGVLKDGLGIKVFPDDPTVN